MRRSTGLLGVSALSGTTWKGARLRLAPAKPDFTARWAQEHDTADAEPPKKRRKRMRGTHGVEARDMAPVTLENYERHRVSPPFFILLHTNASSGLVQNTS